ncbi:ParA family protein [Roseinatronobacter monicus]|uniref:Chromosome partitioning protein n=1 Tax=Roseinatronobacter monicus TaxID=393481 RepID=A0A543K5K9_9RHOB|nr:ParA family protein [Roseinatronobacter monicus]TQM90367.1 chromosome partitioning protein [Roseinatronobacter monicus]
MKLITAYSHKGGTGKTTALMMLASAIDAQGKSALLIDSDPHQSFAAYRNHSVCALTRAWSERFDVVYYPYDKVDALTLEGNLLNANDTGRYDYCLINLPGVDHPFNRCALQYAEVTLIPFAPSALDLMEVPPALDVIRQLSKEGRVGEARVLFTRMKSETRRTAANNRDIDAVLQNFPVLQTQIKDTAIIADLVMRGLLGRTLAYYEDHAVGLEKAEIPRLKTALQDCRDLLTEINAIIDEAEK